MKSRIGLFVILVFVCKNTWSEEFEIIVSRELIQAIAMESHGAESLTTLKRNNKIDSSADAKSIRSRAERNADTAQSNRSADVEHIYDPITLLSANEFDSSIGAQASTKSKSGYYPRKQVDQSLNNNPLFAELQQEVRTIVGEDSYAKLVLRYNDLKRLEDYINSSVILFFNQSLGSSYGLLLTDWMVFGGGGGAGGMESMSVLVASGQTDLVVSDTFMLTTAQSDPSIEESNSLLFVLLTNLTIRNFLYLLLTVFCMAHLVRGVRFLLTGRRMARMRG